MSHALNKKFYQMKKWKSLTKLILFSFVGDILYLDPNRRTFHKLQKHLGSPFSPKLWFTPALLLSLIKALLEMVDSFLPCYKNMRRNRNPIVLGSPVHLHKTRPFWISSKQKTINVCEINNLLMIWRRLLENAIMRSWYIERKGKGSSC